MNIDTKEGMKAAVEWTENHIAKIADGGAWVIPRSGTIVRVYHSARHAIITPGFIGDESIARVIEAMGWTVAYGTPATQVPYA